MEKKPHYVILIDYPGVNLRFAKALKKQVRSNGGTWSPKVIFYVSPQIWAWHESRIHQIARDIDLMLAIFPFEKKWYAERKADFKVEFVARKGVSETFRWRSARGVAAKEHHQVLALGRGSGGGM